MRMKDDHMINSQIKSGYKFLKAMNYQYVLVYEAFSNPTELKNDSLTKETFGSAFF